METEKPSIMALQNAGYGWDGRPVLSDMSLSLDAGGFYFLTGPSGSGKTTLMRLCYMELMPTTGSISIFGREGQEHDRDGIARARRRMGLIHQDCRFLDHLSLRENITMPMVVSNMDANANHNNVDELLEWVGLAHRQDALPPELSGGERQRAALARAVVNSPDLILADEPTGNVDWEMSEKILSLLVQLNRSGKTVLMATHDLPLIRSAKSQVSTRVLRLANGQLKLAGADL